MDSQIETRFKIFNLLKRDSMEANSGLIKNNTII